MVLVISDAIARCCRSSCDWGHYIFLKNIMGNLIENNNRANSLSKLIRSTKHRWLFHWCHLTNATVKLVQLSGQMDGTRIDRSFCARDLCSNTVRKMLKQENWGNNRTQTTRAAIYHNSTIQVQHGSESVVCCWDCVSFGLANQGLPCNRRNQPSKMK